MKKYQILIPEFVPLSNKGEEAIIRGVADSLFPAGNCEIHLFDIGAMTYRFHDGIHVYPGSWFFPTWALREFGLGASFEKLRDSSCSILRHALNRFYPNWIKITPLPLLRTAAIMEKLKTGHPPRNEKESRLKQLLNCDFVVAGHDGGLDEWVCHVIRIMHERFGMEYGIYGVQLRSRFGSRAIIDVHAAEFRRCHFFYCRDAATAETVRRYFPGVKPEIAPDPAFAMMPASKDVVDEFIIREGLQDFFKKPVVMCTCCEPAPIARHCFNQIMNPMGKLQAHRELFAGLVHHIVEKYDVNILFLPHALGPGRALDDREVAKEILRRANLSRDRVRLLEIETGARMLKGLIGQGEFLVAERIHSIIGATGVTTPFLCLGSKTDLRVSGIIGEMLGLPDSIYYLHTPAKKDLFTKFDDVWAMRAELRTKLTTKITELRAQLSNVSEIIRPKIT